MKRADPREIANFLGSVDVEALADSIGPFTTKMRRTENYSGEHREWLEDIVTPKGADIVYQVVKATVSAIAEMALQDQQVRAILENEHD